MLINRSINSSVLPKNHLFLFFFFLDLPLSLPLTPCLQLQLLDMSNNDRVRCTDPQSTKTYGDKYSMRRHYIAKHSEEATKLNEERFRYRSPDCEKTFKNYGYHVEYERKSLELYHCRGNKSDPCSRSVIGT